MRRSPVALQLLLASSALCLSAPSPALAAVKAALAARGGRTPLAEVGELLARGGVTIPESAGSLSAFIKSQPELALSGRRNNLKVSLAGETREATLVAAVCSVIEEHGPALSMAELRLRLSARRRFVPGLRALLLRHPDTFELDDQEPSCSVVRLRGTAGAAGAATPRAEPAALERLRGSIPPGCAGVDADVAAAAARAREVIVIDLDNKASTLESAACRAAEASDGDVLLLACCGTEHNPRVTAATAERLRALAASGRMRLLEPQRDTKNAADFVFAFWVGWLHARLRQDAHLLLVSTDIHLEQTVKGVLLGEGRTVTSNPQFLEPAGGIAQAAAAAAAASAAAARAGEKEDREWSV